MRVSVRNNLHLNTGGRAKYFFAIGLFSYAFVLFFTNHTQAQSPDTVLFSYKSYGLENDTLNVIQNSSYLDEFYECLYNLKRKQDTVVNILHIGDSHIQADFLTNIVRRNFQKRFGNAGRGLIFPARVAGTNEAYNLVSSSTVLWAAKRCVHPQVPLPIGIGGITISTDLPNAKLNIYMRDSWMDYSFNTATLFFEEDASSFQFSVKDTANHEIGFIKSSIPDSSKNCATISMKQPIEAISFETRQENSSQTHATIFGINLQNSKPGILYHAIGVNGAKYTHYNVAKYFAEQTSILLPALIVISLGTNESLDSPAPGRNFFMEVDSLVNRLRSINPRSKIVLTTPQDNFRKRVKPNPGSLAIRNEIIDYAVENGFAFWDAYLIMGGQGSAMNWRKAGLLRPDGVHLTIDGYAYEGDLFFNALMKGYNNYVSVRHP